MEVYITEQRSIREWEYTSLSRGVMKNRRTYNSPGEY